MVFVLGTLASAGGKPYAAEGELVVVEHAEEGEPLASRSLELRMARRAAVRGGAGGFGVTRARVPQRLDPTAPEPPRPSWPRPRRVPPPDDEDAIG